MVTPTIHLTGRFFDLLLAANQPCWSGFRHWLLLPGMLFQSRQQWWGKEKPRPTPHEGLDLCWFQDAADRRRTLDHTTAIPAPFPGNVVKISPDFLGKSIFLAHTLMSVDGRRLYTAFGHTAPRPDLAVGHTVPAGDVLAAVSAPATHKTAVPPHLHITLALVPDALSPEELTWDNLSANPSITLLDPLAVFPTTWILLAESAWPA